MYKDTLDLTELCKYNIYTIHKYIKLGFLLGKN